MNALSNRHTPFAPLCTVAILATGLMTSSGQNLFRTLKYFGDTQVDGVNPAAPVIMATNRFLYGTTQQGGTNLQGTIFKIASDGTGYAVLKSFAGTGDGANPASGLLQGSDGALYGTTSWDRQSGGIVSGNGTIFRINPDGSAFRVLRHFAGGSDGANPLYGALAQATNGLLYGTTMNGGINSQGTVFRIGLDGSNYLVIKKFSGSTEGYHPYGGLIQAADGALYGTTSIGGAGSQGTIFKINLDGSGFTVLHSFSGPEGATPYAGLIQGADGALYGTTETGGANGNGAVYKLNNDGSGYSLLRSLDVNAGSLPVAPLIQGANGVLYGTASFRGNTNVLLGAGTMFQLNVDGSGFRVLKVFTQTGEGNTPRAALWQAPDGTLYGTAWGGGPGGLDGSLFSLLPAAVLSTILTGQGIEVQLTGLAGHTYRIQRAADPAQGWTNIGTSTTGSDGVAKLMDTNSPATGAFYRTAEP